MKSEIARPVAMQTTRAPARRKFSVVPYLFILPHLIFFIAFLAWPLVYGIYISLFEFDFSFPNYRPFIGLGNYANLFNPSSVQFDDFWRSLINTGLFILYSVPPLVLVALFMAMLLNGKYPGRNFFRGLFFAPWSLSAVVASLLGWWLFQDRGGLVNTMLQSLGLPAVGWLGSLPWAWVAITLVTVWWTVGFNSIIFLAALQDIPETLYEAASIDGATVWQQFTSVTLPLLRPVLLFVVTITLIASANLFAQPIIMTRGGPAQGTETVIMRIYREGFEAFRMGSAAAMSIVVALILLIFTVVNFRVFGSNEEKSS
jgi:multiple sugar transport system permease protein